MSDTFTDSIFETDGNGIATFTMNRPDVLNALTPGLKNDYIRMLDMVQGNDAVKALIRFVQLGQIIECDHSASPLRLGDPSV